jgi:hypothetical protein
MDYSITTKIAFDEPGFSAATHLQPIRHDCNQFAINNQPIAD